jgi:uncharacterized phage protein gp47/JayE
MKIPGYEELKERCLAAVPAELDRREGSLIDTAIAPVCAELAAAYLTLESYYDLLFPDTSEGEYLDKIAAQYGLQRGGASPAVLQAVFVSQKGERFTPPDGMRFSLGGLFYLLSESRDGEGVLTCETAGEAGNQLGQPLPCDYLSDFGKAEAVQILTPGEDQESDEQLRERVLELLKYPAFGGNVSDYKEKVRSVAGVGGVRVTPVKLGGGTVGVQVLGSDLMPAGEALLEAVRTLLIPEYQADGLGLAPIGHTVYVEAPQPVTIDLQATILTRGEAAEVQGYAEQAAKAYLCGLRAEWEELDPVVRYSGMIAAISDAQGVVDVEGLTVNGGVGNIECDGVPVEGTITFTVEEIA